MAEFDLRERRVLVVEDEYMLASELQRELEEAGAEVVGPVGAVGAALELIAAAEAIDAAVLDVNLGGDLAYPVADLLIERGIAFVLTTGYDAAAIPPRFAHIARCEKPVDIRKVARALGRAAGA